jgi:hypothetical protein
MSNIRYQTLRNLIFGLVANRLIRAGFCINPAFWIAYLFINLKIRNLYSAFGRNTQNGMVIKICPMFLRQCLNRGNELLHPVAVAPLLRADITTYSPLTHWKVVPARRQYRWTQWIR